MATKTTEHVNFILTAEDKTSRTLSRVQKNMHALGNAAKIGTAAVAAGAAAATAALTRMTKSGLESGDKLAKQADRIGTTTEALVGLQYAATLGGSSSEKMGQALEVMNKRLGEAAQGSGQAKDALEGMGLNVGELVAMDPADAFATIADSISGLDSQAAKAAATSDIFSRANLDLMNTLQGGSSQINKAKEEVERYGLAISRTDAAKIEQTNDAFATAGFLMKAVNQRLAAGMAPALTTAVELFKDLLMNTNFVSQAAAYLADVIVSGMHVAQKSVSGLMTYVKSGEVAMLKFSDAFLEAIGQDTEAVKMAIDQASKELDKLLRKVFTDPVLDWFDKVEKRTLDLGTSIGGAGKNLDDLSDTGEKTLSKLSSHAEKFANGFSSALTNMAMQGKINFKDLADFIIAEMIRISVQSAIIKPFFGMLGSVIPGAIGQGFGSTAAGMATGGMAQAGKTYLVGEQGPELVRFGKNGQVVPNHQAQSGGHTFNVDMRGASVEAVARLEKFVSQINASIERRAVGAVQHTYNRNPGYGAA